MFARTVLLLAVLPSIGACHRPIAPGQPTPALASAAPGDAYVSDLTAVAFGSAFARATADGAPSTDDRTSGADQAVDAAASKDGDERERSCGNRGVQSHAQASAVFQPLPVDAVRQFGFTLSTTAYARGGTWRRRVVLCRDAHETVAVADARAAGRLDLTFTGDTIGKLLIRTSGATLREAHLEVRDGQDRLLPLSAVPGDAWVEATLSRSGPYSVRASISAHVENGGDGTGRDQHAMRFSVSVQSLRDARALGYGRALATTLTLPLPVFMSADAMSAALDSALFTDQHRLYPCAKIDCGTDRLRDVFLETPRVSTDAGAVVLDMHLSGSWSAALVFGGGVSGVIRATAVPVVEHDTLRLEDARVDVATRNLIVKWRFAVVEQRLLERIRNVRIDLTPELREAVAKAQEDFSAGRSGACLLVIPSEAHVRSVRVVTAAPQGVVADFDMALSNASGTVCQPPKRAR